MGVLFFVIIRLFPLQPCRQKFEWRESSLSFDLLVAGRSKPWLKTGYFQSCWGFELGSLIGHSRCFCKSVQLALTERLFAFLKIWPDGCHWFCLFMATTSTWFRPISDSREHWVTAPSVSTVVHLIQPAFKAVTAFKCWSVHCLEKIAIYILFHFFICRQFSYLYVKGGLFLYFFMNDRKCESPFKLSWKKFSFWTIHLTRACLHIMYAVQETFN